MNIGKEAEPIVVEPIEEPAKKQEPATPTEPVKVPA